MIKNNNIPRIIVILIFIVVAIMFFLEKNKGNTIEIEKNNLKISKYSLIFEGNVPDGKTTISTVPDKKVKIPDNFEGRISLEIQSGNKIRQMVIVGYHIPQTNEKIKIRLKSNDKIKEYIDSIQLAQYN